MERKLTWFPTLRRTPDTNRQVIIQCEEFEDPTFGWFDPNKRIWHLNDKDLSGMEKDGIDFTVIAWMEMPEKYNVQILPFEFRSAKEARYLMNTAKQNAITIEAEDFFRVRRAIRSAAERGMGYCKVMTEILTENLRNKLDERGFKITPSVEDSEISFISWSD